MFQVPWSEYARALWKGLQLTLLYTVIGFAGAAVFGLLLALLRLSKSRILRVPAALYTEIFKNIPLLAIIFIIYFGLASIGIKLGAIEAGSLSLILFYAAYLSETFRAAIAGVHAGQQEAAEALGLGRISTFQLVIFPQALRLAVPGPNTFPAARRPHHLPRGPAEIAVPAGDDLRGRADVRGAAHHVSDVPRPRGVPRHRGHLLLSLLSVVAGPALAGAQGPCRHSVDPPAQAALQASRGAARAGRSPGMTVPANEAAEAIAHVEA